ncbi:MAG: single-stranded-DNA-specific exonuclease RecJ [Oscillospiraceae bacterium]|nr:single-stranded-DNA-specific exonuclease RecJ [Oscillospiraceae bacterium]
MRDIRWNIPPGEAAIPDGLLQAGISPLLAAILAVRGMSDPAKAGAFLARDGAMLSDPLLLADMPRAVERLGRAIRDREHVAVYGDYDVDGITSSCMVTDYLRSRGVPCELYIPDRIGEGYGVNPEAIRLLQSRGVRLIVTVDCGVTAVEESREAASLGIDMIITDHHECREELPPAAAVVDPKRPDCTYPNHDLAGVGVAFKLLCALEGSAEPVLERYADLVAVGTVADVMPLVGENREIVRRGIEKLERSPRPGLEALIREAGMQERRLTAGSIGFTLAPRMNASGRLGRVECATALLLTEDDGEASEQAAELCRLNRERQSIESEIWRQAQRMLGSAPPDGPIVLAAEGWHQGVIGIAASRLTEAYHKPAVMICLDGERGKGSCRSCGGYNLFDALTACGGFLEGFGGHALAAGLTIRRENIDVFRRALTEHYRANALPWTPSLDIDLCINDPRLLTMECVEDLDRMEPCGPGNPRPLLCMLGAQLSEVTPIGNGKHLRLRLKRFGESYDAVFFGHTAESADPGRVLAAGDWVDVAFNPQINAFRGRRSVQLVLTDLRMHDEAPARAILTGDAVAAGAPFVPSRREFALVWRALMAAGGSWRGPLPGAAEKLAPRIREEKLCLILRVLEELGLLSLACPGGLLSVSAIPDAGKKDLSDSQILQRLGGLKGETTA